MNSPLSSNLAIRIKDAIDNCYYAGTSSEKYKDGLSIYAEWVDSKRNGYSVIQLTFYQNGREVFSYDDYGTECKEC